ncbi:SDR family oxidoreductase [Pseudonocardia nematodicida]|uniref:SDR family oxidoreductase n=1 Tax=Pseudonocardia nematodicida TaxID=1206997 RepID=A0ABV1K8Z8_9PSEU
MSFVDQVVIVTGAARGIGAEYAHAFAQEGARVLVADVSDGEDTAAKARSLGVDAAWVRTDVRLRSEADAMVAAALQRWGRVDVLVNNAARYAGLYRGPLESIPPQEWDDVMAVNVRGVWNTTAAVLPSMRAAGSGAIVNIASTTALKGTAHNLHYVASKGAVLAATRAIAREVGPHGIRVNCVTPGLVDNEASREGQEDTFDIRAADRARERSLARDMHPVDVVGAVLFLASEAGAFISGQQLTVDGGGIFV